MFPFSSRVHANFVIFGDYRCGAINEGNSFLIIALLSVVVCLLNSWNA